MSSHAAKDFKKKIRNRLYTLFARKRCNRCFSSFGDMSFFIEKIVCLADFDGTIKNKENVYLKPFSSGRPISYRDAIISGCDVYCLKMKQNKPESSDFFDTDKFFIFCDKCYRAVGIDMPKHFFG